MAKRYQKVLVTTWNGDTFRAVSDRARLLFLYLLSGLETTSLTGVVCATLGTLADRMRWPTADVRAALAELEQDNSVAYDAETGVAWLPNALKHDPPINPNVVKGWEHIWGEVPKCALKVVAYDTLRRWCELKGATWLAAFDDACPRPVLSGRRGGVTQKPAAGNDIGNHSGNHFGNGIGNGSRNQYQYQEQHQEQEISHTGGAPVHAYEGAHEAPAPETSRSPAVAVAMAQAAAVPPVAPLATPDAPEVPPAPATPRTGRPEAAAAPSAAQAPTPPAPSVPAPVAPAAVAAPPPPPAPRQPMSPESAWLLAELGKHPSLAALANVDQTDTLARLLHGTTLTQGDLTSALADLASHEAVAMHPTAPHILARSVASYANTAARRRRDAPTARGMARTAPPQQVEPKGRMTPKYGGTFRDFSNDDASNDSDRGGVVAMAGGAS